MRRVLYVVSLEFENEWWGYDDICISLTEVSERVAEYKKAAKDENLNGAINIHLYNYDKFPKSLFDGEYAIEFFDNYFDSEKDIVKSIKFDFRKKK